MLIRNKTMHLALGNVNNDRRSKEFRFEVNTMCRMAMREDDQLFMVMPVGFHRIQDDGIDNFTGDFFNVEWSLHFSEIKAFFVPSFPIAGVSPQAAPPLKPGTASWACVLYAVSGHG